MFLIGCHSIKATIDWLIIKSSPWWTLILPFWGKIIVTSIAGRPSLPTRPACCFSFHAVRGRPVIFHLKTFLFVFLFCIPILTEKFRPSESSPIAATSVETRTHAPLELNIILQDDYFRYFNIVIENDGWFQNMWIAGVEETYQVGKLIVDIYPCLKSFVILSFSWWELSPFSLTTLTPESKARSSLEIHAAEIRYFTYWCCYRYQIVNFWQCSQYIELRLKSS